MRGGADTQLKVQGKEATLAGRPESGKGDTMLLHEPLSVNVFMNRDINNTMNRTKERFSKGKISSHTVDQVADDLQQLYANESIDGEGDVDSPTPTKLRIREPRLGHESINEKGGAHLQVPGGSVYGGGSSRNSRKSKVSKRNSGRKKSSQFLSKDSKDKAPVEEGRKSPAKQTIMSFAGNVNQLDKDSEKEPTETEFERESAQREETAVKPEDKEDFLLNQVDSVQKLGLEQLQIESSLAAEGSIIASAPQTQLGHQPPPDTAQEGDPNPPGVDATARSPLGVEMKIEDEGSPHSE